MPKSFFTNYFIGARGDFLSNCLYDSVPNQYRNINALLNTYAKVPPLDLSVKMHGTLKAEVITKIHNFPKKFNSWRELFDTVNEHNLVKIKILANTLEEKFDITWMAVKKVMTYDREHVPSITPEELQLPILSKDLDEALNWMFNLVKVGILFTQEQDREFIEEYNYIVNFNDLFDASYIASLFEQVNGKKISSRRYDSIVKNISMQERLSTTEYYSTILQQYNKFLENSKT